MNAAITLDPTDQDPSDLKVRNKWFFSFQVSLITGITYPNVKTNRVLMCPRINPTPQTTQLS